LEKKAGKLAIFAPDALSGYSILKLSFHVIAPSVLKRKRLIFGCLYKPDPILYDGSR